MVWISNFQLTFFIVCLIGTTVPSKTSQNLEKSFGKKCDLHKIVENHPLLKMPNVLVTPHNAFNTKESLMRIVNTTIKNIQGFKKSRRINVVK